MAEQERWGVGDVRPQMYRRKRQFGGGDPVNDFR
jgi:hypothetical protein